MKRIMSGIAIGAMVLGSVITFGVGAASAAATTSTIVLSGGKGVVPGASASNPATITATTSAAGSVSFTLGGVAITGCTSVATTTVSPFVATCPWVPTVAGPAVLGATFVPTDTVNNTNATAAPFNVTINSTLVLSGGKGVVPGSSASNPATITATSSTGAGSVSFTLGGVAITGCTSVATTTVSPFVATCPWVPTVAGPAVLGATFVPTDTVNNINATAVPYNVTVAAPIQGVTAGPIYFTVDAVGTSNNCGIQSSFVVGDGIVFRVSANDADLGGVALTSANVSSATITVKGYATVVPLTYANHGGLGMWTGVLQTGTATGQYSPTGAIPYTITMQTIAVPAVTKKVSSIVRTRVKVGKKYVIRTHRVWKTVVVTPAVPGITGTFSPSGTMSALTLLAAPVTLK